MRVSKILSIAVVSLAGIIVVAVVVIGIIFFIQSRGGNQQNFAPIEGQKVISPVGSTVIVSQSKGSSSFLYRNNPSSGTSIRLTSAPSGIESEPVFSHDGKFVLYSFADSSDSKSSVWVVGTDGSNPHAITGKDEDALHPVFSPDDSKVFYGLSNFTGNHSPIVRPARHDWDVFSIPIQSGEVISGASPTKITHASFYDLHSLDVAADGITTNGMKLLISTTGYPIGGLFEEFNLDSTGGQKIFQPHVQGESSISPSYGEARFIHQGMDVVFLAATDTAGGTYDYNVYSMSDVTGSEIKQLTHLKGMTSELKVLPDGRATFINGGVIYALDASTQTVKPL